MSAGDHGTLDAAAPRSPKPEDYERNVVPSYGLTIVAGLPLPPPLTQAILGLQAAVERALPGRFHWYQPGELHVTLAAPLRGRYRAGPPLGAAELPAGFAGFLDGLAQACRELSPIDLALGGWRLHRGTLSLSVEGGAAHAGRLRELLSCCEGFDLPKHPGTTLHLSFGFAPSDVDASATAGALAGATAAGARGTVDHLLLVHYSNRTLTSVVGRVRLPLGRGVALPVDAVLAQLGIVGAGEAS